MNRACQNQFLKQEILSLDPITFSICFPPYFVSSSILFFQSSRSAEKFEVRRNALGGREREREKLRFSWKQFFPCVTDGSSDPLSIVPRLPLCFTHFSFTSLSLLSHSSFTHFFLITDRFDPCYRWVHN